VEPVNQAFAPTAEEIAWAAKVLDALDEAASNDLSVAVAQGMMVDAPHALQARRILERADGSRVEPAR
jgi:citrate lyase subunit beta/citryl-CoA lyase